MSFVWKVTEQKKENSTLNSDESAFTFASSVATLHLSPNMNFSSHSSIIPFFIIPICLSAACLHCNAPSLLHRGASSSCALLMCVHMSLIHLSSPPPLFHFHPSVRMRINPPQSSVSRGTNAWKPQLSELFVLSWDRLHHLRTLCTPDWQEQHKHGRVHHVQAGALSFSPLPT